MFSEQDKSAVIEQLKAIIVAGKFTCHRCHYPLGGTAITQIDLFNGRVVYKCANPDCDNHNKSGYRTFRAMNIDVPAMNAPAELASIAAPAPPRPEEVHWSDGSDESVLDVEVPGDDVDDSDEPITPVATPTPKPTQRPIQKPTPAPIRRDIGDNPDSEE
jgi:hypothetical protein